MKTPIWIDAESSTARPSKDRRRRRAGGCARVAAALVLGMTLLAIEPQPATAFKGMSITVPVFYVVTDTVKVKTDKRIMGIGSKKSKDTSSTKLVGPMNILGAIADADSPDSSYSGSSDSRQITLRGKKPPPFSLYVLYRQGDGKNKQKRGTQAYLVSRTSADGGVIAEIEGYLTSERPIINSGVGPTGLQIMVGSPWYDDLMDALEEITDRKGAAIPAALESGDDGSTAGEDNWVLERLR